MWRGRGDGRDFQGAALASRGRAPARVMVTGIAGPKLPVQRSGGHVRAPVFPGANRDRDQQSLGRAVERGAIGGGPFTGP